MAIHSSKHGVDRTEQELSESPPENEPKLAGSSLDSLFHDTRAEFRRVQGNAEQIRNTLVTDLDPDRTHQSLEQTIGLAGRCQVLLAYERSVENLALTPLTEQSLTRTLLDCVETIGERFENLMIKLEGLDSGATVIADRHLRELLADILLYALEQDPGSPREVSVRISPSCNGCEVAIVGSRQGIEGVEMVMLFNHIHRLGVDDSVSTADCCAVCGGKPVYAPGLNGNPLRELSL